VTLINSGIRGRAIRRAWAEKNRLDTALPNGQSLADEETDTPIARRRRVLENHIAKFKARNKWRLGFIGTGFVMLLTGLLGPQWMPVLALGVVLLVFVPLFWLLWGLLTKRKKIVR